jgi:hypothetical protein
MLLQGSPSAQRPNPVRPEPPDSRSHQRRAVVPEPAAAPARARAYPPITWDHPSLGKVVTEGLGGISKSTLQLILVGAALIGSAVAIALVIGSIVSAFGIDAAARY